MSDRSAGPVAARMNPLIWPDMGKVNTGVDWLIDDGRSHAHCLFLFFVFFLPPWENLFFEKEQKGALLFSRSCSVLMTCRLWVMTGLQNRGWGCLSIVWQTITSELSGSRPLHNGKKGFISIAPTKDCQNKGKYRLMQIRDHAWKLEGHRQDLHHTHECFCALLRC